MENNNILEFYRFFVSKCNLDNIYNMFENIDNVLILSDSNNIRMAKWLAIILNQKHGCIATADSFSIINDSRIKVYNNIFVLDSKTEDYIKRKNFDAKIIFINQILENIIENFEKSKNKFILSYIIMGLMVYYGSRDLDMLKNIIYKIDSLEIKNISQYDVIVSSGFISFGMELLNNNFNAISFINYIDQNKNYGRVLYLGSFSLEEKNIINDLNDNGDFISCEFNDEIEQIIYGSLFVIKYWR